MIHFPRLAFTACALSLCAVSANLSAAYYVINDPARVTGANAIDPATAAAVGSNASNSTSQATLEGLPTFGAIQDFSAFTGSGGSTLFPDANDAYIVNFSSSLLPDIQFRYTGSIRDAAGASLQIDNNSYLTSSGAGLRLQPESAVGNVFSMNIDLGQWDGASFLGGSGVDALGFTLSGRYDLITDNSISVTYRDADNNILSSQVLTSASSNTSSVYTGYQISSGQDGIASVEIVFTTDSTGSAVFGLDDFGFTAVPEPARGVLLLGGLSFMLLHRPRRKR